MYIYPTQGQSVERQDRDKAELGTQANLLVRWVQRTEERIALESGASASGR